MVLGKLPVPGRLTNLDYSTARAYSLVVGAGGHLFSCLLFPLSSFPSLRETGRYRLKCFSKGR